MKILATASLPLAAQSAAPLSRLAAYAGFRRCGHRSGWRDACGRWKQFRIRREHL